MILAGEVVKEGAFADVGGFRDVLNGGFGEAFVGEKLEGSAEKALAGLSAAALTAGSDRRCGACLLQRRSNEKSSWLLVIYDYRSFTTRASSHTTNEKALRKFGRPETLAELVAT